MSATRSPTVIFSSATSLMLRLGRLGMAFDHVRDRLERDADEVRLRGCARGGGAGLVIEYRKLAEEGPGLEARERDVVGHGGQHDVHRALLDDVEILGNIALAEDRTAAAEHLRDRGRAQRLELARRDVPEDRDILQRVCARHGSSRRRGKSRVA
jgi:hypothetical protein